MSSAKSQAGHDLSLKAAVFIFFLSIYLMTLPATNLAGGADFTYMFFACQSFVEDGDVNILNQGIAGFRNASDPDLGYFNYIVETSKYPLGPSLIAIPFYVTAKWGSRLFGRSPSNDDLFVATCLSGPVLSALSCLLLFVLVRTLGFSPRSAFLAACFYGLGTIAWSYARWLCTEAVTTLSVLSAIYGTYRYKTSGRYFWIYLSGFFSGLAMISRELSVLIVPPLLVYLAAVGWKERKGTPWSSQIRVGLYRLSTFLLGWAPFLVISLWYNVARYGVLDNVGYITYEGKASDLFSNPFLIGLYGFLFSPGQSLFLFCPVLVLVFFSIRSFYSKYKAEFVLMMTIFLLHWMVYAKCNFWHGGISFGPRYLLPTIPLLILPMAAFLETLPKRSFLTKAAVLGIFCLSILVQTLEFWAGPPIPMVTEFKIVDSLDRLGDEVGPYFPHIAPIFRSPNRVEDILQQFYFAPKNIRSLRLPMLLMLLSASLGAGFYLVKEVQLMPSRDERRSSTAGRITGMRDLTRSLRVHMKAVYISGIALIVLTPVTYIFFRHVLSPLSQFHSRAFGTLEYPHNKSIRTERIDTSAWASDQNIRAPEIQLEYTYPKLILAGSIEASGWVLDRSGIRAVEIYMDEVKVADAHYGEASPTIHTRYPSIPNSDQAHYSATGIDTTRFSNGLHTLTVKALNQKGVWTDVARQAAFVLNDPDYNFWNHIEEAKTHSDGVVEDSTLAVSEESRRVLLQNVGSEMAFENVPVYDGALFQFGFGFVIASEVKDHDGLLLEVMVNSNERLFSTVINPKTYAEQPVWRNEQIDLSPYSNQVISLTFSVKMQSRSKEPLHQIGWSDLSIVYPN